MDPVVHHPGPIDDSLLTLQTDHRSEAVWNMREEEQLLEVDSAIDHAAPDLNRAQSLLQGVIARVRGHGGPLTRRGRRPITPVEPEPGTYYTHVGSSSWSHHVGTSTAPDRDARAPSGAGEWPRWTEVATETAGDDYVGGDGGFAVNLGADEDTSPSGGHTHVSPPLQESYQFADRDVYRPDMSFLTDQYTTPPLQAPVPSFGSPSYVFGAPAFPVTPAGVRSTPTPVHCIVLVRTLVRVARGQYEISRNPRGRPSLSRDSSHPEMQRGRAGDVTRAAISSGIRRSSLCLLSLCIFSL
ncbi:hypothetical protein ACET3Z_028048 [Daucus carota]